MHANGNVTVSGGTIDIVSNDDGLNAAGGADQSGFGGRGPDSFGGSSDCSITISGGMIRIDASGDVTLDSLIYGSGGMGGQPGGNMGTPPDGNGGGMGTPSDGNSGSMGTPPDGNSSKGGRPGQ